MKVTTNATGDQQAVGRRARTRAGLAERLARPAPSMWLSGAEAAEYVGVSWPTMRALLIDHDIPHLRIGVLWRIEVAVLDEHLHALARTPKR